MNLELAALAPSPASCITTHTPSILQEDMLPLSATALIFDYELVLHLDDDIMQDNHEPYDSIPTCSNTEEQSLLAAEPNYLCTDDFWHASDITLHESDHDGAVTDMGNSLNMWDNWFKKGTSQCETLNNGTSSSASQSISPGYLSHESSTTFLADTDTSFIEPSQLRSDASSFTTYQHNPHHFHIKNPVNEQFDINLGMQSSPISDDRMSFSQGFVYGNAPVAYSGSPTSITSISDDNFFDSGASSFAAILSPPPHALNFPRPGEASPVSLYLEARASRPQLNLEARAGPLQQSASHHDISATGAMRNTRNRKARQTGEAVSILVESSTPAIDDGHVWRKYGQKDIKDRIHPRSYYRCAQPNCPIRKQIENSSDKPGFMLITYLGKHSH